jgi:uncharacterized protein
MERPLPLISHLSEPFWQAAHKHQLVLQKCRDCGSFQWYPKAWCVECGSTRLKWEKAKGLGTIYSFTIIQHAKANPTFSNYVPFAIVAVELDEGPRMYGRLLDYPIEKIRTGTRVKVVFEDLSESISLPQFAPVEKMR